MKQAVLFVILVSAIVLIAPSTGCSEETEGAEEHNLISVEIKAYKLNFPIKTEQLPQVIREQSSVTLTYVFKGEDPQFSYLEVGDFRFYAEVSPTAAKPYPVWKAIDEWEAIDDRDGETSVRLDAADLKLIAEGQEVVKPIQLDLPDRENLLLVSSVIVEPVGDGPRWTIDPPPVDIKP
jgi:hypothetical protein